MNVGRLHAPVDDPMIADYVYRSAHASVLRRRREWFEATSQATLVLWWVPAGNLPSVADGAARLEYLRTHGPTAEAFTFRAPFAPDDAAQPADDRNGCPA
jgi:hypothetical protein